MSPVSEEISRKSNSTFALFDANAVALATLFGTPVAGTLLMAINYRRLGQTGKAAAVLLAGILVTAGLILVGWNMPRSVTTPLALAVLYATRWSAAHLQGPVVQEHVLSGGRLGSRWAALGFGVALLAVLFGVVFLIVTASGNPKITIGSNDDVSYSGTATKEEALALGAALKVHGYFQDQGASVSLDKGKEGTVLSFVTKEGSWDQPDNVANFEELGREVASSVGGFPIKVRMTNKTGDIKEESLIGIAAFRGDDNVYYMGQATVSDAQALGRRLEADGFFQGKGADVFLSRHSNGTMLSFVVGQDAGNDPATVSGFEKMVRALSGTVGGLPIRLRLMTPTLDVEKDEVVQ